MVDSRPDAHDIDPQSSGRCSLVITGERLYAQEPAATAELGSYREAAPTGSFQTPRRRPEGAGQSRQASRPSYVEDPHQGELPSRSQPPVRTPRPPRDLTRQSSWERHDGSRNAHANSPDGKLAPSVARRTSSSSGRFPTRTKGPTPAKLSRSTSLSSKWRSHAPHRHETEDEGEGNPREESRHQRPRQEGPPVGFAACPPSRDEEDVTPNGSNPSPAALPQGGGRHYFIYSTTGETPASSL